MSSLYSTTKALAVLGTVLLCSLGCKSNTTAPCSPLDCATVTAYPGDSGKALNLRPGQSLVLIVPAGTGAKRASSSDERVVLHNVGPTLVGNDVRAGYVAVGPGTASIMLGPDGCSAAQPQAICIVLSITVVALPHTTRQLSHSDDGATVKLRTGDLVLVTLAAATEQTWNLALVPTGVMSWKTPPLLYPRGNLQGVLEADSPGEATFSAISPACAPENIACSHQIVYHFSVG